METASPHPIEIQRTPPLATIWLSRPERLNALNTDFFLALPRAMDELSSANEIRTVIIAAQGPHFSVGLDLMDFADLAQQVNSGQLPEPLRKSSPTPTPVVEHNLSYPPSDAAKASATLNLIRRFQEAFTAVEKCSKPTIAVLHGYCIGGGLDLAAACDIRVAASNTTISLRETRMAMVADLGSLQRLPHIVGSGHLAELAFTGKDITAARAKEIGLVNEVFADRDEAYSGAKDIGLQIASNSPLAVQGTKAVLQAATNHRIDEGLDFVALWNAAFLRSADLTEAMIAFAEKRPPQFHGE
ncbi:MAG: enoyl-CoA hydratase-related protein [Actinobacteria bacterium]|jgi:enoyl-CoA hydratase|nr:enoyl-CoA hydratase-related protein [Actinomycetota bacterium]MCL6094971.1 enoyl-CoA hydratase-related protein [Actinomycetota bacterium]